MSKIRSRNTKPERIVRSALHSLGYRFRVPTHSERAALKEQKVILTERDDTATVERKVGGIKGKPRYYAVDIRTLRRLASE